MTHCFASLARRFAAAPALLLILFLVSTGLAAVETARAQDAAPPPVPASWEKLGLKDYGLAPEIKLQQPDGSGELKLSEMVKKGPVLVDFWATWCGPCREAMPKYAALYEQYRERGFSVLAVSEDSPQATGKVLAFMEKMELPFPVVLDLEKDAAQSYYVRSLPSAYLIDRRGHVVDVKIGYAPGREKHLAEQIEALLDAETSPGVEG